MKKTVALMRIFVSVLCVILVLSIAACSKNKNSNEIMVWLDDDNWASAAIEAFNAKYPDITVNYQNVGNVDSRAKVSLDGPAGIGPDVFLMPHDHIGNAIIDDICEPFSEEDAARYSQFIMDSSIKTCTFDGKLYALPISTENIAFFYNKDLLGDAPVPTSFEEIKAFADQWNDPSQNRYALRWQVDDAYHNYFFLTAYGMSLFGPNMDDYRNPGFDSEAALKGVEFHNSLRRYFNVNVADAGWDTTVPNFQRGEVPFTITGPWAIGEARTNGINFGTAKLPTIEGKQPRSFSGNIVAVVSSYSKNFEAAFAFADFLASIEGVTIQFNTTGKIAAYTDVSGIPGLRDDPLVLGILEQAPYADPMPTIPEVNQMWDALKCLFTFTWDNQLSPAEAQEKAMETYDNALQIAGKSR